MKKLAEILLQESRKSRIKSVNVPNFKTSKEAQIFLKKLGIDDSPNKEVADPETGEVYMMKGTTKRKLFLSDARKALKSLDSEDDVYVGIWPEDFEKYYNVVYKDGATLVDNPKELRDNDYAIDIRVPYLVRRKSKSKVNDTDIDNLKDFIQSELGWPDNIEPLVTIKGGNTLQVDMNFN